MKLDLKSSITLLFFIGFAIFFVKWWVEGDSNRKENQNLKNQINQIQNQRDSLVKEREKIDLVIKSLESDVEKSKIRINQLNSELVLNKKELKSAKDKLNSLNNRLAETKRKINELKANPIKRTGDDLIRSIKEKTK